MPKKHSVLGACVITLMIAGFGAAHAQVTFPVKPIRIVTAAVGGGPSHLRAELFKSMAGVNFVPVPYKGGGPALLALLGGEDTHRITKGEWK